jgi:hypothetical protein
MTTEKSPSEIWMRAWATEHVGYDYYGLSDDGSEKRSEDEAYAYALIIGEENHVGPYEDARDYIDDTWWNHWETITGKQGEREVYFSCSC